jgi:hypothetical protein
VLAQGVQGEFEWAQNGHRSRLVHRMLCKRVVQVDTEIDKVPVNDMTPKIFPARALDEIEVDFDHF